MIVVLIKMSWLNLGASNFFPGGKDEGEENVTPMPAEFLIQSLAESPEIASYYLISRAF